MDLAQRLVDVGALTEEDRRLLSSWVDQAVEANDGSAMAVDAELQADEEALLLG